MITSYHHSPLICVCHTASPTPHRPAIAKKINGFSGCGRQNNITTTIDACTTAPRAMITERPMYFIIEPKMIEQMALTTPKQIIT